MGMKSNCGIAKKERISLEHSFSKTKESQEILLSQLLSEPKGRAIDHCTMKLTLEPSANISLIDDLAEIAITHSEITIILLENSKLSFSFSLSSDISCCCVKKCAKKCSCPAVGVDKVTRLILQEKGAKALVRGSCLGRDRRSFSFTTIQDHRASETASSVEIKGALFDQAAFMSDNLIRVASNLKDVTARQINKNLMMSDKARIRSLPKLEVKSNGADCSHGAAISQLNNDHLFYLASRGIESSSAMQILLEAFLG
jgi:hypothetical protein